MADRLQVEVVQDRPGAPRRIMLALPPGATVADAVAASGWMPAGEQWTAGIHGRLRVPGDRLADGDRVELYRDLLADPKQARRQRARLSRR